MRLYALSLALLTVLSLAGCQSSYFSLMDKAGISKREMLVDRIEDARDAQIKARYAFSRAADRYQAALHPSGNAPPVTLEQLQKAYADSSKAAAAVAPRVEVVEHVGDALFEEWRGELSHYRDAKLVAASRDAYDHSRAQYQQLLTSMRTAQTHVAPALENLNEQLLLIKHRRNAEASNGLDESTRSIPEDVAPLLIEMQRSIDQAGAFVNLLQP